MKSFPYVLFVLLAVLLLWKFERRQTIAKCKPIIMDWAEKQGMQIVNVAYPLFMRGPFSFPTTKMQRIFRVTLKQHDQFKVCWIKIGHPIMGLKSAEMEVKFDE